jgi:site-specific recombinase XerD
MKKSPHPAVDEWLVYLKAQGKSNSTISNYRRALAHFATWSEQSYDEPFEPAAIIPRDVTDWKAYQQTVEKVKPATFNLRLVALSRFFEWAVTRGHVQKDPTVDVQSIRLESRRPKSLNGRFVRRLLRQINKAENERDAAIVELLLGAGLRVSELLALKRGDITLGERSGKVIVRYGKGGLYRRVPLTKPVRKALRVYLDTRPQLEEDDLIWVGERGPLQDRGSVLYLLKKYAFQAGLDESLISPHILRHTFAARYLKANPDDLRGLAAILGHSNLNTVMIYTEPSTNELASRMEKAEAS